MICDKMTNFPQILTLKNPVKITNTVRPVCFSNNPGQTFENKRAVVTGWGETESGDFSENLKKVKVKVISINTCKIKFFRVTE